MLHDLRATIRALARAPSLVLLATATRGVGMGASTAISSAVNAAVLRPPPYRDRDPAPLPRS